MKVIGYINGQHHVAVIEDKFFEGSGNIKIKCPVCPSQGKKKIHDLCLSVDRTGYKFNCHKCGWQGYIGDQRLSEYKLKIKYDLPQTDNQIPLSDEHKQLFNNRLITEHTLLRNDVKTLIDKQKKQNFFIFNYYLGNQIVKAKYKNKQKAIYQYPNCKPIIYKYNDVVNQDELIICEGEEEALIWEEAGYKNACSVDSGAPNEFDKNINKKLECITNCYNEVFAKTRSILIAVDNDSSGMRLKNELIKRLGYEKCKIINFKPCKDANEYALKFGIDKLKELIKRPEFIKIDGLRLVNDCEDQMLYNYYNGQPVGTSTFFKTIDPHYTWRLTELNIWTGYGNEGKSMLLKNLLIAKSLGSAWKHAIFTPEEMPADEFYTDLVESTVGKSADPTNKKFSNYMSFEDFSLAKKFINEHFILIDPEPTCTLDNILALSQIAVRVYGIKTITIDPYNQIDHDNMQYQREDLYISKVLSSLKKFAVNNNILVNLVAHQKTPIIKEGQERPKPDVYMISGGAKFYHKSDNVLSIYRPKFITDKNDSSIKFTSEKIKKPKLTGRRGTVDLAFNLRSNQYEESDNNSPIKTLWNQYKNELSNNQNYSDLNY